MPSGSTRGTHEAGEPAGAWASTRKTSFIGAEVNHLWPCRVYSPSTRRGPRLGHVGADVGAALLLGHPHPGQRTGLVGRGHGSEGRRSWPRAPGSTPWRPRRRPAAPGPRRTSSRSGSRGRARSATTRRSRRRGVRARAGAPTPTARPAGRSPTARSISQCQDGWKRDLVDAVAVAVVRRQLAAWCSLASIPCSRASAVPASAPSGVRSSTTSGDPCRVTASESARSEVDHVVIRPAGAPGWWLTRMSGSMWIP